jgi:hypothetical protein
VCVRKIDFGMLVQNVQCEVNCQFPVLLLLLQWYFWCKKSKTKQLYEWVGERRGRNDILQLQR